MCGINRVNYFHRCRLSVNGTLESLYASSCEYVEHAKMCVNNILRRSMDRDGLMPVSRGVTAGLSTLESAMRSGASFKRFWCEMPKVRTAYI